LVFFHHAHDDCDDCNNDDDDDDDAVDVSDDGDDDDDGGVDETKEKDGILSKGFGAQEFWPMSEMAE